MDRKVSVILSIILGMASAYAVMAAGYPQLTFIAGVLAGIVSKRLMDALATGLASPLLTVLVGLAQLSAINPFGVQAAFSALSTYLAIYIAYVMVLGLLGGAAGYEAKELVYRR